MPKISKVKRCNIPGSTPVLSYGELGWNAADGKLFAGNAANQPVLINAPSIGGGGGGSSSLIVAATPANFPPAGSAANLYCASDTQRVYRWDAANSVYVEVGPL